MKTINVTASAEESPRIETWYAANEYPYGVACTTDINEAEALASISKEEYVICKASVSHMFPGTPEDWNRYISGQIIDTMDEMGMLVSNIDGKFIR